MLCTSLQKSRTLLHKLVKSHMIKPRRLDLNRTTLLSVDIVTFLDRSLKCTYFLGEYYLQIHGAAMGAPCVPVFDFPATCI